MSCRALLEQLYITSEDASEEFLRLDGIQPMSGDLQLGANIVAVADGVSSIGDIDEGLHSIHFAASSANVSGPRTDFRGLHFVGAASDFFVGSDPAFPTYYVQKTVKVASTATDQSEEATNLFQGAWGAGANPVFPFIEMNYGAGDGSVGGYVFGADGATYIRDGSVAIGSYVGTGGGGGLVLFARAINQGVYFGHDETNGWFEIRTLSGSKVAQYLTHIALGGTQCTNVIPIDDDQVSLGDGTRDWEKLYLTAGLGVWGTTPPATQQTYTAANVSTDRALDATGDTLNQVADVLGTLIADLQATGLIG